MKGKKLMVLAAAVAAGWFGGDLIANAAENHMGRKFGTEVRAAVKGAVAAGAAIGGKFVGLRGGKAIAGTAAILTGGVEIGKKYLPALNFGGTPGAPKTSAMPSLPAPSGPAPVQAPTVVAAKPTPLEYWGGQLIQAGATFAGAFVKGSAGFEQQADAYDALV